MSGPRRRIRGVTLVEVLIATLLVSLVIVSASWAMSAAAAAKQLRTEEPATAALLAREIHELAVTLPAGPAVATPASSADEAVSVGALDGARFSPAILATGDAAPDGEGWVQEVAVAVYDIADASLPVNPGYEPVEAGSGRIYRLSVHMRHGTADRGTWWWWMSP